MTDEQKQENKTKKEEAAETTETVDVEEKAENTEETADKADEQEAQEEQAEETADEQDEEATAEEESEESTARKTKTLESAEVSEKAKEATPSATEVDAVTAEDLQEEQEAEEEVEAPKTFTGDTEGKVYTFDELQAASEDYSDDEYHELVDMYEGTLNAIEEKEIVTGRVVSVDEKYVVVDIGFKSEGIVQKNEFPDAVVEELEPGDEVEVFLDKVEDREGQLILSRRKADILQAWETIENSYYNEEVLEGYIKRRIKGGMVVEILGIDAFLPGSQIDVRPVRDFDAYVGKTMEFKVVKLNMQAENVVVSHRALIESDLEEQRQQILETIEAGQVLEGSVKNITDFGVFIDLGGVDGLLHITDLSWGRVEHPSEIVSLDQRMNVAVIDFDEETKRVSLGLKQLQPHPWDEIEEKYPEGIRVQGRVVSIADYGAFIELEKGVEGLIHISEMSWTQHIKHPSQLVKKDDIIECVVLNVNKEEHKISLGVKQLEKDPWENLTDRYPVGSRQTGKVRNITNFGVFVELEPGIDGLVHISDLSWTEKINHPSEVVSKGDDMEVVILAVDLDNRRITLGHKQIKENPWKKFAEEYPVGSEVEGKVVKVTDKGIFVETPVGLDAFLPGSKVESEDDFREEINEGDDLKAYVIEFDEQSKNITLSQREKDVKQAKETDEKKPSKSSRSRQQPETGVPTLGEMSGLADLKEKLSSKEKEEAEAQKKKAEEKAKAKKEEEKEEEAKAEPEEEAEESSEETESESKKSKKAKKADEDEEKAEAESDDEDAESDDEDEDEEE